MTTGWNEMKKVKEESGGGLFIKLKDGDEVQGVFRGEPYFYYQNFHDPEKTEYSEWQEGCSFKFKVPFIVKENGAYVAKIFQGGATMRDFILEARDENGLEGKLYKIKRKGSTKDDTKYFLHFKGDVSPEEMSQINEVKLPSIRKKDDVSFDTAAMDEPPPIEDSRF